MTKERKLAIEMWKQIRKEIEFKGMFFNTISMMNLKAKFTMSNNLDWECNCWFCQYVRRGKSSRLSLGTEGCNLCPIATEEAKLNPCVCGCVGKDSLFQMAMNIHLRTKVRLEACDKIIKALEGEKYE